MVYPRARMLDRRPGEELHEVVVVGAGIAGLACAGALAAAGRQPLVVDKGRGVGGRCATRRIRDQPVDHGVAFYHGEHPEFLAALAAVPATALPGWPRRIVGQGPPCQPEAFTRGHSRLAFVEGATAFPKALARGLALRLATRIVAIEVGDASLCLRLEAGPSLQTRELVLTPPAAQTLALLPRCAELASARALLDLVPAQPCLTLMLGYAGDGPRPEFDVCYPEDSPLQMIVHDSAKRSPAGQVVLVAQATRAWSRAQLEREASSWQATLLAEVARVVGPWAHEPVWLESHRWRYAHAGSPALASPMLVSLPGGARIGLTGEAFGAGAGVQGAYLAGLALARRMLAGQACGEETR
jgi:renalase